MANPIAVGSVAEDDFDDADLTPIALPITIPVGAEAVVMSIGSFNSGGQEVTVTGVTLDGGAMDPVNSSWNSGANNGVFTFIMASGNENWPSPLGQAYDLLVTFAGPTGAFQKRFVAQSFQNVDPDNPVTAGSSVAAAARNQGPSTTFSTNALVSAVADQLAIGSSFYFGGTRTQTGTGADEDDTQIGFPTASGGQLFVFSHPSEASSTTLDHGITASSNGAISGLILQDVVSGDTTPDAFSFTDLIDQPISTLTLSSIETITGIDASTPISVDTGEYRINGGAWVSAPGNLVNNDTVQLRHTSSSNNLTTTSQVATIGGVLDQWDVTTIAAGPDTTPDAFSFTDLTDQALNTVIESSIETITGINASTPISVDTGEYRINGGAWVTAAGNLVNNDTVQLRHTSGSTNNATTSQTPNIGGVTDQWDVTTIGADVTDKDQFRLVGPTAPIGYTDNNASAHTVEQVDGRYRAPITANPSNVTLHLDSFQGRLLAKLVSLPCKAIARNIGVGTIADSQVAPPAGGFLFGGIQIHNSDLNLRESAHMVAGQRDVLAEFTIEGKTTRSTGPGTGVSTMTDEGTGSAPLCRVDMMIEIDIAGNITASYQQPNMDIGVQADNWILYNGTGTLPGTQPTLGVNVYIGIITYIQDTNGLPFVGTCDSFEVTSGITNQIGFTISGTLQGLPPTKSPVASETLDFSVLNGWRGAETDFGQFETNSIGEFEITQVTPTDARLLMRDPLDNGREALISYTAV